MWVPVGSILIAVGSRGNQNSYQSATEKQKPLQIKNNLRDQWEKQTTSSVS